MCMARVPAPPTAFGSAVHSFSLFSPLILPVGAAFAFLFGFTASFGLTVVLLSASVSVLTLPFTVASWRAQVAQGRLRPQVEVLRRRCGQDRHRLAAETAALYRANGISPVAGCLPALASAPPYFGVYKVISGLAHGGRAYVVTSLHFSPTSRLARALAAAPGMHSWGLDLAQGGIAALQASAWSAGAVVFLAAVIIGTGLVQQHLARRALSGQPRARSPIDGVAAWLPAALGVAALVLPLGVTAYYATSGLMRAGQLWVLSARHA